jgi:hypothetical protein
MRVKIALVMLAVAILLYAASCNESSVAPLPKGPFKVKCVSGSQHKEIEPWAPPLNKIWPDKANVVIDLLVEWENERGTQNASHFTFPGNVSYIDFSRDDKPLTVKFDIDQNCGKHVLRFKGKTQELQTFLNFLRYEMIGDGKIISEK